MWYFLDLLDVSKDSVINVFSISGLVLSWKFSLTLDLIKQLRIVFFQGILYRNEK